MQDVEVVISFDVTGSMYPCLTQVRREVKSFLKQLFSDIPNIKVGLIAHGDYCDEGRDPMYLIKEHPLSGDEASLIKFVTDCGNSGGGDAAECYELVLHNTRSFKWTAGTSKVLILMGDDVPHNAKEAQNKLHLDWRNELNCLLEMGVKVYGVQALRRSHATPFYKEIAKTTGGFQLDLDQFSDIINLIYAICYQQVGNEELQKFETKLSDEKKLTRSMSVNLARLLGKSEKEVTATLKKAYGDTDLAAVPPSRFQVLEVKKDIPIADFVKENGLIFHTGKGFYQFTKPVDIQSYKEVILVDKVSGDMFNGNKAREIMGIPVGENARCKPEKYGTKYDAYIQSTSNNRKLIGGTKFLYEVDLTR